MRLVAQIAKTTFWFAVWAIVPTALLYPAALWMVNHTHYSEYFIGQSYDLAVAALFLPPGFLVDFLYRKFILKKTSTKLHNSDP